MKKLLLNSTIIFILVIFPLIPSYLHLYNQVSSPEIKLCYDNGNRKSINILKGDIAYLEAIFSRALENKNSDEPISHEINRTINILFFISQSKIGFIKPIIKINKLFFLKNNDLPSIYLKITSPPPKTFS